ncbi:MAG: hypothetical protein E7Z89_00685 [Cyanobacteria bacterium SIG28]|nr:hypothetical protein [Cyanobacteria bacterium SIG28]
MSDINSNLNINAHYSSNPKVDKPVRVVVSAPTTLPSHHLYNDIDANNRFKMLNKDIYIDTKNQKAEDKRKFVKGFGLVVLTILAVLGIKKLGNIFKKS